MRTPFVKGLVTLGIFYYFNPCFTLPASLSLKTIQPLLRQIRYKYALDECPHKRDVILMDFVFKIKALNEISQTLDLCRSFLLCFTVYYFCNILYVGRPKKRKLAVAVSISDDSLEPTPELSNVIRYENR